MSFPAASLSTDSLSGRDLTALRIISPHCVDRRP